MATAPVATSAYDDLQASREKIRALKAADASYEQVVAAIGEFKALSAALAKIRALKQADASQADVRAAIGAYTAIRASTGSHTHTHTAQQSPFA